LNKIIYFNTIVDKKGFHGRFEQFIFSKGKPSFSLKLVLVESKLDIEENSIASLYYWWSKISKYASENCKV